MSTETITILAGRAQEARKAMAKLQKKAKRYGVPLKVTWQPTRIEERTRPPRYPGDKAHRFTVSLIDVTLEGEKPVVGDYEFLASIELTSAGNYVDMVPGAELDPSYRTTDARCEHCHSDRKRKHVYVVRERSTGKLVQVGRTCLRDFLGLDDPKWILQSFAFWRELRDADKGLEGFGRVQWSEHLDTLLAYTLAAIKVWGWTSKGQAMKDPTGATRPTVSRIWSLYSSAPAAQEEAAELRAQLTDKDFLQALDIIIWVRGSTDQSDYMHNLRVAFHDDMLWDERRVGLAISAVAAWHRATEQELKRAERQKRDSESQHVGAEGERLRGLKVRLETRRGMGEGSWGWSELLKFRDEQGNILTWFTGSAGNHEIGAELLLDGTVKRHTTYNGVRETQLNRVSLKEG